MYTVSGGKSAKCRIIRFVNKASGALIFANYSIEQSATVEAVTAILVRDLGNMHPRPNPKTPKEADHYYLATNTQLFVSKESLSESVSRSVICTDGLFEISRRPSEPLSALLNNAALNTTVDVFVATGEANVNAPSSAAQQNDQQQKRYGPSSIVSGELNTAAVAPPPVIDASKVTLASVMLNVNIVQK